MNKSSNYRIRVDPELHQKFLDACKSEDKPAAQVIREFMRAYVEKSHAMKQADLFIAEPHKNYKRQGK
jgi:predicted DNA-binding protein